MGDFVFEIDMDELAVRLIECASEIKRPDGLSGKDALDQITTVVGGHPAGSEFVESCKRQAVVCWEFVSETINKSGHRIQ